MRREEERREERDKEIDRLYTHTHVYIIDKYR